MRNILLNKVCYTVGKQIILSNITCGISRGEKLAIVGDNGSGKSTLLEILLGDLKPSSGSIDFIPKNNGIKNLRLGLVYDHMPLFPLLTVSEVVSFLAVFQKIQFDRDLKKQLLSQFNLTGVQNRLIKVLSAGERQRVALLLSVLNTPELLILDEAFSNIDPIFWENIWEYIAPPERTVIFTSHNWEILSRHATRIMFLHNGEQLGEILSPQEHLNKVPGKNKIVCAFSRTMAQHIKESNLISYNLDNKISLFPADNEHIIELLKNENYSIEAINLKDVFMLYKSKKI